MSAEQGHCEHCRFWEVIMATIRADDGTTNRVPTIYGNCHHGPPVAHDWPQKQNNDWCGCFEPLPQVPSAEMP